MQRVRKFMLVNGRRSVAFAWLACAPMAGCDAGISPTVVNSNAIDDTGAIAPATSTADVSSTALAPPVWVEILGGNWQTAGTSQELPIPLRVRVKNDYGHAMPGVTVLWSVLRGGGAVSRTTTVTNSEGITQISWTLGSLQGTQSLRAAAGNVSSIFEATAEIRSDTTTRSSTPSSIAIDPTFASLVVGQELDLDVTVRDENGNRIEGATVAWRSTDSSIAHVTDVGRVSARASGSAVVVATAGDRSAYATISIESEIPEASSGEWPNQPSGLTRIAASDWMEAGSWKNLGGNDDLWTGNGWTRKTRDVDVVSVSGLPTGTTRALRITTPAGTPGGYGPWAYHSGETTTNMWRRGGYREIYFAYWVRIEQDFIGHPSGSNKQAAIKGRSPNGGQDNFWILPWGGGRRTTFGLRFDASPGIWIDDHGSECGHSTVSVASSFKPGRWQRVEQWYRKPLSTGAAGELKIWIDGDLVASRNNVCDFGFTSTSHLFSVSLSGIWGGAGGQLTEDNVQDFGPFLISGR